MTPLGATVDLSVSYNAMVVLLKAPQRLSLSIVPLVMKLITTPKSVRVLVTTILLIYTSTIRLQRSKYFGTMTFPSSRSTSCPMELIVGEYFLPIPDLLRHSSLMNLSYMRTSLMGYKRGILTYIFFSSPKILASSRVCVLGWMNLSG